MANAQFLDLWFWAFAAAVWGRAFFSVFGVPNRLAKASDSPEAAALAYDMMRYRLGRGRLVPLGLAPFRWPMLGGAVGYALVKAAMGDFGPLILAAMLGPIFAADVGLEPRALAAIEARRSSPDAQGRDAAEQASNFTSALEDLKRARRAATLAAAALTLIAVAISS